MLKKIIASAVAGTLAVSSVAAAAAPIAFESADRAASNLGSSEELGEGSDAWLVLLFLALAAGIIVLVEQNEGDEDDLPASP